MTEKVLKCQVCESTRFSPFIEITDYFLSHENFSIQICDACGLKFINPRPDSVEIVRYYESDAYISHDTKEKSLINRLYKIARVFTIKRKYKIVARHLPQGRILDIGCGTGDFLSYCKSKGFDVTGVEPNDKAGAYARQVNKIDVYNELNELNFIKGSFNCITMWHVLEHLHDLNNSLALVKGLLRDGGVFVIAVPNCNSWDAKHYEKFWAAYDVPRHLYHFNVSTLTKLVTNHGFAIQKLLPQKLDAYYVSLLSEKYRSGKSKYVKSLLVGFWSNILAGKQDRGYSSQIFVLSLKKG